MKNPIDFDDFLPVRQVSLFDSGDGTSALVTMYSDGRDKDVRFSFPLAKAGIVEQDVLNWWSRQPFDLALDTYEGNCHLCFLKKRSLEVAIDSRVQIK